MIPCAVADCRYGKATDGCNLTVYVGGLYGTLRAADVAEMFRCLFGDVEAVTLFTDRHDYPTGKAHVEHTASTKRKQNLCALKHYASQLHPLHSTHLYFPVEIEKVPYHSYPLFL